MTNKMIILMNSIKLMEDGVIKGSGIKDTITVIDSDGEEQEKEIELPESIHTYQAWKQLGYQVRKGEKAVAQFPIWKHTVKKAKTEDEEDKESMFMKTASFFTVGQVEKIEKEA